jgi:formylglycine-generating enzyme required for sulfatase activity
MSQKIARGNSWFGNRTYSRSASRNVSIPRYDEDIFGFRIVMKKGHKVKTMRGGCSGNDIEYCRSASRTMSGSHNASLIIGLRVVK